MLGSHGRMAQFTVRVVLHDSNDESDYETLWEAMALDGFERTITGDSGKTYRLPPAEYAFSGDVEPSEVCDRAAKAAKTTGLKHGVLVTEAKRRNWVGLDPDDGE